MEIENLTEQQCYNEIVMTGLRTSTGIDVARIRNINEKFIQYLDDVVQPFINQNKIIRLSNGNYALAPEYFFLADGIAAEMFWSPKSPKGDPVNPEIT